jgi:hypothetical protein
LPIQAPDSFKLGHQPMAPAWPAGAVACGPARGGARRRRCRAIQHHSTMSRRSSRCRSAPPGTVSAAGGRVRSQPPTRWTAA